MDREKMLKKIKSDISDDYPTAKLILYGSRARGDFCKYSDWDFLIIFENNVTNEQEMQIRDKIYDLELESGEVLCFIIHSKKEWENLQITPFYRNVEREGIYV
ncbi:MAG: nucleotidyltransferase domain-containing protein [Candidatus Cloacimonetes bacterium]|nr:nucleotidyltransferase domain-containing protein [Candidatus Cloacimonadota bacterium]